mgnify:CR=1 FL=1
MRAATAAKPKVADYPFTTLHPGLGVVDLGPGTRFVLADIPGLIEGAAEGAGLGHRFLGHVERCGVLLHLVDGNAEDVAAAWRTVRGELKAYGHGLADKPEIVGLNKIDTLTEAEIASKLAALEAASGSRVLALSGVTGAGVAQAMRTLLSEIRRHRAGETVPSVVYAS